VLTPGRRSDAAALVGLGAASIAVGLRRPAPRDRLAGGLPLAAALGVGVRAALRGALAWVAVAIVIDRRRRARSAKRSERW
jgi:hypothetical protein